MTSREYNKRKGAKFEIDLADYLRTEWGMDAERLPKAGRDDQGDVAVRVSDTTLVIEAKNEKAMSLSQYLREATVEADHYRKARGSEGIVSAVAVVKARGKGIGQAYVVMEVDEFALLIKHLRATTG